MRSKIDFTVSLLLRLQLLIKGTATLYSLVVLGWAVLLGYP